MTGLGYLKFAPIGQVPTFLSPGLLYMISFVMAPCRRILPLDDIEDELSLGSGYPP